ncbi:MAG: serine/threonine-protein kinase [Chthoniobacter sp.]
MPETAIFDHYEVLTRDDGSLFELGRGAMGITYKAFDRSLRIPVALKVINATYLNSEVARQRFVREARSAAQLRHRHVASVFHLGTEGDTWFYAMEFIDGETLDALIKRQGPLAPVLALTITAQVARALNAAAQHGLVHRDIKPANLMLVKEDDDLVAKVIDFGLAKASVTGDGEDAATLSMGGFVGTPHFASPEQLEEKEIDSRSDIYSLGVTLWYMLAGQAPFAGSMAQVMSQHLSKPPPFEKLDKLPPAVADVLRLMLAKDPAERFQTPAELRKGIEAAIEKITGAGGAPAMSAEAVEHSEDFATLLEDSTIRSGMGSFETNTTIANRYRVAQSCGESNAGRVFRAYDTERKMEVRPHRPPCRGARGQPGAQRAGAGSRQIGAGEASEFAQGLRFRDSRPRQLPRARMGRWILRARPAQGAARTRCR